ncbi:hypothetical protein DFJ69_0259 [Thermomonospora umbrina]|uniref:Uncharacterized protein n=1 Tax=Thermomonospora umbrina TaxID=111806 RepID=A0A3D9SKH2_9ACTN|nr:hypothetical protein DFJ69_0259 [Thermomonospora umbrina]
MPKAVQKKAAVIVLLTAVIALSMIVTGAR